MSRYTDIPSDGGMDPRNAADATAARPRPNTPSDAEALAASLTAAAEDPMWANHAEVNKATLKRATEALRFMSLQVDALHHISLASQNSMSSKEACGRIARAAMLLSPGDNARAHADRVCWAAEAQPIEALREAAMSLRTLARETGRGDGLKDSVDVRAYANSRATVAEQALAAAGAQSAPGPMTPDRVRTLLNLFARACVYGSDDDRIKAGKELEALFSAPAAQPVKAERVHTIVNASHFPGMSEAFDAHMGAACWTDPAYAPDASMWAAAWKVAKAQPVAVPQGWRFERKSDANGAMPFISIFGPPGAAGERTSDAVYERQNRDLYDLLGRLADQQAQATAAPAKPPAQQAPYGWVVWWLGMDGARRPVFNPGPKRPTFDPELDSLVPVIAVYESPTP